jgi:hypothetical protein
VRLSHLFSMTCLALLAGCGDAGGVNSAGSTPTPTPTPTNTTLTNLQASQSFTNDAATTNVAFDLTTKTTIAGTAQTNALTVSYDAPSKSYTLTAPGRTQTFASSNVAATTTGDVRYQKTDGTNRDYLTLVKVPYTGTAATQYVGLGFWQRNIGTGTRQDTSFDTFTYGLTTPASAVPRTGSASFGIDVFGLSATPGSEPREFQGHGSFGIDLAAGVFSTNTYLTETGLLSGNGITGGGIQLQGSGHLSSSDGTFSGDILYGGQNGSVAGLLTGRFYGPSAEELGASFSGGNADGATVTGSFTGQRDTTAPAVNETLTNIVAAQLFYTHEAVLSATTFDGNVSPEQVRTTTLTSQFNRQNSDTFTYGPGESDLPGGSFTATSAVASTNPNFTAYQKTFNGQDVRLELYKPGGSNTELALTYASFGRWSSSSKNGVVTQASQVYFAYGLETTANLLSAKTGTAHYAGLAYGAGANQYTGAAYDVKGTSSFDVDFLHQNYTGALALKGTSTSGAAAVDFGTYTFAGALSHTTADSAASLVQGGNAVGALTQRFYGPGGEEIAGPFTLVTRDANGNAATAIAGVAVAKRP